MKLALPLAALALSGAFFFACQRDPAAKIPALEKTLETSASPGLADTLIQLYQAAAKAHPDKTADNLHYLTRAAELKFLFQKDELTAVRWLNAAIKDYGADQNLTEPIGMLTRIGHDYLYHKTPSLSGSPDDIDEMQANLLKYRPWIDSSLMRLEKEIGSPVVTDKAKADMFIKIAETYAALLEQSNPDKQVDLLLMAGALAKTIGNPNKAVQLYYNVGEKLPDHPKAPTALFMQAFIYETDLKDLEKAKATYELFLKRYPKDPDYADDAENALKLLGIPDEEIMRQFEQNPQ
jgi:tetratricopeptide (TPR) repeat protein